MDQYIAFIPVRGGSKSIPLKNIKKIGGRPLVCWTVEAAAKAKKIDRVYVATDSGAIREAVLEFKKENDFGGKVVCVDRDPSTATDTASTESAMLEFAEKHSFGQMVLIQATSPLLDVSHLDQAIAMYEEGGYGSLLSVVRQKRFHWQKTEDGSYEPMNYDYKNRPRRQEFDGCLVENGAFYITGRESLLESGCRLSGRIGAYEMPEETYFEIDEPSDWVIIEHFIKNRQKKHGTDQKINKEIKLFVTDCDGCLTDGSMYYSEQGDELKRFHTLDGMGISLLHEAGIKTAIITGEDTKIVERRAKKLKVDHVCQGTKNKLHVLHQIAEKEQIPLSQVAYMGDDINDLECLRQVGVSFTVPNAVSEVKQAADYIVDRPGGSGAVREAIEMLLKR